jgi:hypothetical protein
MFFSCEKNKEFEENGRFIILKKNYIRNKKKELILMSRPILILI